MYRLNNRIVDKLTGFNLASELNKNLRFDSYSGEQIKIYQENAFNYLKNFAVKSDKYQDFKHIPFEEFPIITKEELQTSGKKFHTNFRKPYKKISTSGSSGIPLSFFLSKEMLLKKRASQLKMLAWYGLNREDREMKIGGGPIDFKTKTYYLLRNKRYHSSFNLSNKEYANVVKNYNKFKPKVLYGYPSSIADVISFAIDHQISLHKPQIVLLHAENLYEHIKILIQNTFPDVFIVNQYWATEANLGVSCPEGNVHIDEDTVICEVLNPDADGVGDLIITNLYSFDFPLIRYNLGDRVKISDSQCPCGRKTKIFERIEGRSTDYCQLKNGKRIYYAGNSVKMAKYCKNIAQYQVIYENGKDKLTFSYKQLNHSNPVNKESIMNYFKKNYDKPVEVKEVDSFCFESSGKFKTYLTVD
jgi:phenylacetate-CoA ligase